MKQLFYLEHKHGLTAPRQKRHQLLLAAPITTPLAPTTLVVLKVTHFNKSF